MRDTFRGLPAVMFYEDKDSTATNQSLKEILFATAKEKGLLDAATVVAVANVAPYDWFPARNIVVSAVKDSEKAFGLPIYLDWSGELTRPPWSLKSESSSVVVLDKKGAVRWSKHGKLTADEIRDVCNLVESLIGPR
ncbi:MAG: hypothetical protein JNK82_19115 [Myxococcaceae bacterium]|nr:hypothetical protein [Myxococcaceae bacterium]